MTKPLPFTQAGLTRAIKAARAAGMRVVEIKPDGTLVVDDGDKSRTNGAQAPLYEPGRIDRANEVIL